MNANKLEKIQCFYFIFIFRQEPFNQILIQFNFAVKKSDKRIRKKVTNLICFERQFKLKCDKFQNED